MAKLSVRSLIIIAVVCGLGVASLMYVYLAKVNTARQVSTEGVTVVVARVDIPNKTVITKEMVQERIIPAAGVQPGALTSLENVVGLTAIEKFVADEQIVDRRIIGADGKAVGFTGVIPKDHRAVTVKATAVIGVGGLIKPGDYVDVIATFDKNDVGDHATSTVLQNLLVLAINKEIERSTKDSGKSDNEFTVTLAVLTQDISRLVMSDEKGKVRLALRPYLPEEDSTPTTIGPRDLVEAREVNSAPVNNIQAPPDRNNQPPVASGGVVVIRGTKMFVAPTN